MSTISDSSRRLVRTTTPGIYRRGSRYVIRYRDPQGRQRKAFARTLAQARDLKAALTADVKRGEYRAMSRVTFAEYARQWIATYQGRTSRGLRDSTRHEYMRALGLTADGEMRPDGIGAVAVFGRRRLAEIEPREIKAWLHRLAEAGASPSTVRSYLAPLRALFATAVEEGLIRSNPAAGLRLPSSAAASPDGEERAKALTEQELARLLAATPAEWRLIVRLLAFTGLRLGEALALRWSDIDLGRRRLHVRRRVYAGKFAPPKSRYGRRQVPLSESLARELWARRKALRGGEEALVFPGRDGEPLDASTVFRVVKSAARAAGVPWAGPHVLRHTCATMLFRRGLNAKQVQLWLGHHSPAFTLATYVHLLPDDLPDVPEPSWAITAAEEAEPAERPAVEQLAAGAARGTRG